MSLNYQSAVSHRCTCFIVFNKCSQYACICVRIFSSLYSNDGADAVALRVEHQTSD